MPVCASARLDQPDRTARDYDDPSYLWCAVCCDLCPQGGWRAVVSSVVPILEYLDSRRRHYCLAGYYAGDRQLHGQCVYCRDGAALYFDPGLFAAKAVGGCLTQCYVPLCAQVPSPP